MTQGEATSPVQIRSPAPFCSSWSVRDASTQVAG